MICVPVMRTQENCISNSGEINNYHRRRRGYYTGVFANAISFGNTRPSNNVHRIIIEFNMYYVTRIKAERDRKWTTADEKFEGDTMH